MITVNSIANDSNARNVLSNRDKKLIYNLINSTRNFNPYYLIYIIITSFVFKNFVVLNLYLISCHFLLYLISQHYIERLIRETNNTIIMRSSFFRVDHSGFKNYVKTNDKKLLLVNKNFISLDSLRLLTGKELAIDSIFKMFTLAFPFIILPLVFSKEPINSIKFAAYLFCLFDICVHLYTYYNLIYRIQNILIKMSNKYPSEYLDIQNNKIKIREICLIKIDILKGLHLNSTLEKELVNKYLDNLNYISIENKELCVSKFYDITTVSSRVIDYLLLSKLKMTKYYLRFEDLKIIDLLWLCVYFYNAKNGEYTFDKSNIVVRNPFKLIPTEMTKLPFKEYIDYHNVAVQRYYDTRIFTINVATLRKEAWDILLDSKLKKYHSAVSSFLKQSEDLFIKKSTTTGKDMKIYVKLQITPFC